MFVYLRSTCLFVACATLSVTVATVSAQSAVPLSGRLVNSLSGDAIPGAVVLLEELRRQATSDATGSSRSRACRRGRITCRCDRRASRRGAPR